MYKFLKRLLTVGTVRSLFLCADPCRGNIRLGGARAARRVGEAVSSLLDCDPARWLIFIEINSIKQLTTVLYCYILFVKKEG